MQLSWFFMERLVSTTTSLLPKIRLAHSNYSKIMKMKAKLQYLYHHQTKFHQESKKTHQKICLLDQSQF
jgi:hypothetical protein